MPLQVVTLLLSCLAFFPAPAWGADSRLLPAPDSSGKWGYVNSLNGKTVIAPRYSRAGMFNGGFAVVHMAFPAASYAVWGQDGELAPVLPQGDGIIDAAGREILAPVDRQYVIPASPYGESRPGQGPLLPLYEVQNYSGRGVLDAAKGWILPPGKHESIRFFADGSFTFNGTGYISAEPERAAYTAPAGYRIVEVTLDTRLFVLEDEERAAHKSGQGNKKGFMAVSRWSGPPLSNMLYENILLTGCKRWAGLTLGGRLDVFEPDGSLAHSIGTADAPHMLESGAIIYRRDMIRYVFDPCTLEAVAEADYTPPPEPPGPLDDPDFKVVFNGHKARLQDSWGNQRIAPLYELLLPAGGGYWWGRYDTDKWILLDSATGKEIRIKEEDEDKPE